MADMASPRAIIDFYGTNGGPAIPKGNGLRPIGPVAAPAYPVAPYQAPVQQAFGGKVLPSGPTIELGGRSPVPALRPPAGGVVSTAPTVTPGVQQAPRQIGYTPAVERTMPNARGLKATTVFGRSAAPIARPTVSAAANTASPFYRAGTAFAKATSSLKSGVTGLGLRAALRGAGGGLITDLVLPNKANAIDDVAAINAWRPPADPRNNQQAFRRSQEGPYSVAPTQKGKAAAPSARKYRPVVQPQRALPGNPPDPPQGFGETPSTSFRPMISEQTDAAGVLPASIASQVEIGGDNGGFGFTKNADGTVERMFSLRQRTAAEDVAAPRETNQGVYPAAAKDMSPGSQGAWEREQKYANLNGLMSAKDKALIMQTDDAQEETRANNLRSFSVSKQNADTTLMDKASEVVARDSELPIKLDKGLLENQFYPQVTRASLRKSAADATGQELTNQFYPQVVTSELGLRGAATALTQAQAAKVPVETAALASNNVLEKQAMINAQKQLELEARNTAPINKADAEYAALTAGSTGLLPSEVAAGTKAGYRKVQKAKSKWFGPDQQAGLVNDKGELFNPGVPAGYKLIGTSGGKPVYQDANGKKVWG